MYRSGSPADAESYSACWMRNIPGITTSCRRFVEGSVWRRSVDPDQLGAQRAWLRPVGPLRVISSGR